MIDKIKDWSEKTGIFPIGKSQIDLQSIVNACNDPLSLSIEELGELINKANAYNIFLKSMKGSLIARLTYLSQELDEELYLETQNVSQDGMFLSKEEKRATVLRTFKHLKDKNDVLLEVRMKYLRMKDVPQSIDMAINSLKMLYNRRINEENKSGSRENAARSNN
jgi:hypothetical protein